MNKYNVFFFYCYVFTILLMEQNEWVGLWGGMPVSSSHLTSLYLYTYSILVVLNRTLSSIESKTT